MLSLLLQESLYVNLSSGMAKYGVPQSMIISKNFGIKAKVILIGSFKKPYFIWKLALNSSLINVTAQ